MKYLSKLALAACAASVMAMSASAQDIKLRMGTFIPATHFGAIQGSNVFLEEVEKRVGDQVEIEFYPAQQAGKAGEALDLVRTGAIDIYELGTSYFSGSDLPLWGLIEVPNLVKQVCDGTRGMRALGEPGEILWDTMYAPQGIRILSHYVYPAYGPAGSIKEITSIEDLQGMKMRTPGGLTERTALAVGGVPVTMTSGEVHQALQRKTLDTYVGAYLSVKSYEYHLLAPYGVTGFGMGTPGIFAAINEAKFQSLPKEVQDALIEAGKASEENFCNYTDNTEAAAMAELQTGDNPMTVYTWTDEEVAQLTEMTAGLVSEWVNDLDSRGLPGTQALEAFKNVLP